MVPKTGGASVRVLPPFFFLSPLPGGDPRAVKIRLQRGSVRFRLRQAVRNIRAFLHADTNIAASDDDAVQEVTA